MNVPTKITKATAPLVADDFGTLKAEIARLEKLTEQYRQLFMAYGVEEIVGRQFTVTTKTFDDSRIDVKLLRAERPKIADQYTVTKPVTRVVPKRINGEAL